MKKYFLLLVLLSGLIPNADANVVGPDAQNFNPTTNGVDYVTVQSSSTLEPGILNLGAFFNYAVNSLPIASDEQNRLNFSDTLLMSDFNFGIGVLTGWDIGFSYPRLWRQVIDTDGPRGQFTATGNTELRFNTKWQVYKKNNIGSAIVLSTNLNRIRNNPYTGSDPGPSINTELVVDRSFGNLKSAINLGYRARNPGDPIPGSAIKPTRDQLIGSVGMSYFASSLDTKFIVEFFASRATNVGQRDEFDRQAKSAEVIGGVKYDLTSSTALHAGGGTELIQGAASPDWRAYAGINWSVGPAFERTESVILVEDPKPPEVREFDVNSPIGPVVKGQTTLRSYSIKFKFDSVEITDDSVKALEQLAEYLKAPPVFKSLVIEGHTDSVGSEAYNQSLSVRRAESIKSKLVSTFKLEAAKITTMGYGESRPIADNSNYQGRQKNRRVDFVIDR